VSVDSILRGCPGIETLSIFMKSCPPLSLISCLLTIQIQHSHDSRRSSLHRSPFAQELDGLHARAIEYTHTHLSAVCALLLSAVSYLCSVIYFLWWPACKSDRVHTHIYTHVSAVCALLISYVYCLRSVIYCLLSTGRPARQGDRVHTHCLLYYLSCCLLSLI
jgi:hypothetical protein